MIQMMEVLFPHMNQEDRLAFLSDIKACDEIKFAQACFGIREQLDIEERRRIEKRWNL